MTVHLKQGEHLLQEVETIWYNSEKRASTFVKLSLREDVGTLFITDMGMFFKGFKFNFRMSNISNISRKKIKLKPGAGAGYIEITYIDEQGLNKRAYFLVGALAVWDMAKQTDKLYTYMLNWLEKMGKIDTSEHFQVAEMPTPPPVKLQTCPTCGGKLDYIEEYKRFYCYICEKYA
jgi:hypothetical protein